MQFGRILALIGTVIAALSLLLKVLVFDGVDMLPALSRDAPGVPAEIPTILASFDAVATVAVVVSLIVVVVLAFWPPVGRPQTWLAAGATTAIGATLWVFVLDEYKEAQDQAAELQVTFLRLQSTGSLPEPLVMSFPNAGFGFLLVLFGTVLITVGGVLGLVSRRRSVTQATTDGAM